MTLKDILSMLGEDRLADGKKFKFDTDYFATHPYNLCLTSEGGEHAGTLTCISDDDIETETVMVLKPICPVNRRHCDHCNRIQGVSAGYCFAPHLYFFISQVGNEDRKIRLYNPSK